MQLNIYTINEGKMSSCVISQWYTPLPSRKKENYNGCSKIIILMMVKLKINAILFIMQATSVIMGGDG